jgi:hypothetical protein
MRSRRRESRTCIVESVDDLPSHLAATIPDVYQRWDSEVRTSGIGADEPYNQMAVLARVLVANRADVTAGLADLFNVFEDELAAADPGARDLLIVGFLEDLQNASLHANVSLAWWRTWFGPLTGEAWTAVEELWSGGLSATAFDSFMDRQPGDVSAR